MNHWWIETGSVWHYLPNNHRLSFRPLLEAGLVQLHNNALAMRVPRACVASVQPLFEAKEPLAVVAHGVLFGRDDLARGFHRRAVRLEGHLEEGASRRRLVGFAGLEDRDVAPGHLPSSLTRPKLDLAKRHDH